MAGAAPRYTPGIRRVYARYTPEQVSELDRGRHASAREKPAVCPKLAVTHYVKKVYARGVRRIYIYIYI